jgi:hypothetical protein
MRLPFLSLAAALTVFPTPAGAAETISVPAFRGVALRGGGTVELRHGPVQRVAIVEGSSAYTRITVRADGRLEIDACDGRCPHVYRLRIEIESPDLPDLSIRGGGDIHVDRFPAQRRFNAAVSGGGEIDARAVEAEDDSAAVSGGGAILLGPSRRLSAAVNGGGAIRYAGNPSVSEAVNGGGSVAPLR